MNRRHAILALGGAAVTAGVEASDPPGDVSVPTATGIRNIKGKEAESYHAANAWLEKRLREVESIRAGSTHADVVKLFHGDGGTSTPTKHRFVLILCPFVKVDVEFEDKPGVKARHPVPATAKVVNVSKPYFEREFGD